MTGLLRGRGRRESRGQTLVEFALVVPLFLLVVLAIAEGGYFVVATTIVSNATHEGARLGVLESTNNNNVVKNRVIEAANPVVGLDPSQISVCIDGTACTETDYADREVGQRLTVTTDYKHKPLVGYVFGDVEFDVPAEAELLVEGHPS
jgi:hypothetical protein